MKTIKDFLSSNEKTFKIEYTGNRMTPAVDWGKIRNPVKAVTNAIISEVARNFLPPCKLKNALYRLIGVKIGKDVMIGPNVFLDPLFPELITIDDGAIIGGHSIIFAHEFTQTTTKLGRVRIGKKALIGTHCTIRAGVTIGDYATVASASYVHKDLSEKQIVGGVPAKPIEAKR